MIASKSACLAAGAWALAAVAAIISPADAGAQEFPAKQITLVAPYGPGATLDTIARKMAEEMGKSLGQPVIVENRPGADGQIGMDLVANRSQPDGYTIMISSVPAMMLLPHTYKDLQFDPLNDFIPFIGIGEGRYLFGSAANQPWKSIEEMVAYNKEGGRLLYGASNPAARFWAVELVSALGLEATSVPYKDSGVYIQALGSGEVSMGFLSEISALSLGDRFHVMATTGSTRTASFPDAPTFSELELPQMGGDLYALSVPAGTPQEIVETLHDAASAALKLPAVKEAFANFRVELLDLGPQEIGAEYRRQYEMFAGMAKAAGITPQ